jgi:hypothetical protein
MDHPDCILRHAIDIGYILSLPHISYPTGSLNNVQDIPPDARIPRLMDEVDALAWRALAWSQELHEKYGGAPLAPGAKVDK